MDKTIPLHLQEIIFASSDPEISRSISALVKQKKLKKIAPKIYTSNLNEEEAIIIERNIFKIIGHLYNGALLSHRSAIEFKATSTGDLFITYTYERKVSYPGITLNIMKGPEPLESDYQFVDGLYASSQARAILENLQQSRKPGPNSKTLTIPELEIKLDNIIRVRGEQALNQLRDEARAIAEQTGMEKEFTQLDRIIGAMLVTRPSKILKSAAAQARVFGLPYDTVRIDRFNKLFTALQEKTFPDRPEKNLSDAAFRNFAFYEAYFSNFIEGTKFKVEEALEIIRTGKPLPARHEDGHDVLGTYHIVSNRTEMTITPKDPSEMLDILKYRHKLMLSARPEKNPGEFKNRNNMAGNTDFVDVTLVTGTLHKGFEYYNALQDPFAKAAYMMFLISEVHPFVDGNGRLARVMMNAELTVKGQSKIIIPTVYREDYLGALRALSRRDDPEIYINMLMRAWEFSATLHGEDMNSITDKLNKSNSFEEGQEYILQFETE